MQTITVRREDAEQRLDKYLFRVFPLAPHSFIYRMLRRKNIVLNGKKAEPSQLLREQDTITCFFSEETFGAFSGTAGSGNSAGSPGTHGNSRRNDPVQFPAADTERCAAYYKKNRAAVTVLYEDESMLALDKPAGMFAQPQGSDLSAAEWLIGYLMTEKGLSDADIRHYRPSPCHRLDRNTSGILLCARNVRAARLLSDMFRDRTGSKEYRLIVSGIMPARGRIEGVLQQDGKTGLYRLCPGSPGDTGYSLTEYETTASAGGLSMVKARLITGRKHQLRVHMASVGHPIIGDPRYGDRKVNASFRDRGIHRQLLHCERIVLPDSVSSFMGPADAVITSPLPDVFMKCMPEAFGQAGRE